MLHFGLETAAKANHESRTVNGKTFDSIDEADIERSKKRVGWALGLGILCLPYIFSFFTFRKGYSSTARIISIGWLLFIVGFRYSTGTHSEQPVHSSEASAVASTTPANNPVDEIPFTGKRTFNFYGGTGTQMSIEIQKSGTTKVESYGTSGTLVEFSGKFSNPLPINKTNSLLFKNKRVFLTKSDGTIEKGCSGDDNVTCESELFSE